MPTENEKRDFKERWLNAVKRTFNYYCMYEYIRSFNRVSYILYSSVKRHIGIIRKIHYFNKKYLWGKMTKEEAEFWNHPLRKQLFDIWQENVAGKKKGWRAGRREQFEFIEYMFKQFTISRDSENAEKYDNFKNLAFSLKRWNPQKHICLFYSFIQRPIKKYIRQYFNLAAITGEYDLLLKRYPPYHNILAAPGEWISFDLRGLDFRPLTLRSNLKYSIALELERVQTRNGCFITCPVIIDEEAEKERYAEISKLENDLKKSHVSPAYLSNVDFEDNGKVYFTENGKKEEIPFYGKRTGEFIWKEDQLNLLKMIPRPGSESGLIIRFNLLDKNAVLLDAFYKKQYASLDEIQYVLKCLDLLLPEAQKKEDDRRKLDDIVDEIFEKTKPGELAGLKYTTIDFINELERLRAEDPSEKSAWKLLISTLTKRKNFPLLKTIYNCLADEEFDFVFNLWPLLTGKNLMASFILTEQSLDKLKEEYIPESVIEQLKSLENHEYTSIQMFMDALKETIGENHTRFNPVILRHAMIEIEAEEYPQNTKSLPFLDNLKSELENLLKKVFTGHIDISARTKRIRSEPVLAEMIIEHCLTINDDKERFRRKLTDHFEKHYDTFFDNIEKTEPVKNSYKSEYGRNELLQTDVEGVIALVDDTRSRLTSPKNNNRLLHFIDQDSISVLIGNFEYEFGSIESKSVMLIPKNKWKTDHEEIIR